LNSGFNNFLSLFVLYTIYTICTILYAKYLYYIIEYCKYTLYTICTISTIYTILCILYYTICIKVGKILANNRFDNQAASEFYHYHLITISMQNAADRF
jgi:hypothetical protein